MKTTYKGKCLKHTRKWISDKTGENGKVWTHRYWERITFG